MLRLGFFLSLLLLSAPFAEGAAVPFYGRNLFEIFGVNPREPDPRTAFKAGYRALAKRYHPDRNLEDKQAEAAMKRINELMAELEKAEFRAERVRLEGLAPVVAAPPRPTEAKAPAGTPPPPHAPEPAAPPVKPAHAPGAAVKNPDAAAAARAYGRQQERGAKLRGCPGLFTDFSA